MKPKWAIVLLVLLAALLYGGHIRDGFLSDDFLYLSWASEGLGHLMAKVTVESYPRMIRPWPALGWAATGAGSGGAALHALSILLHALNAGLLALILRRKTGDSSQAALLAALFLAFPLFTEPVIWLSASFDLWATFFALVTLFIWRSDLSSGTHAVLGSGAFILALMSKESIVLLPLILLLALPWDRARTAMVCTGAVAIFYFAIRFFLFHGLGGYENSAGQPLVAGFSPVAFIRAICAQLPFRILVPLKRPDGFGLFWAHFSAALLIAGAIAYGAHRKIKETGLALVGMLLALAPVAPIFRIEADHEGSRLIYFPLAILMVMLGGSAWKYRKLGMAAGTILLISWSAITMANGRSWRQAAVHRDRALNSMSAASSRIPAGATVLVDAYDTYQGAYVFRNGLPQAAAYHGFRQDIHWKRGTIAMLGDLTSEVLGSSVFEIGYNPAGAAIDWTPCQQAMRRSPPNPIVSVSFKGLKSGKDPVDGILSPWVELSDLPRKIYTGLEVQACGKNAEASGTVFWRLNAADKFTITDERAFKIVSKTEGRCTIRMPELPESARTIQFRIDFYRPIAASCLNSLSLLPAPPDCP